MAFDRRALEEEMYLMSASDDDSSVNSNVSGSIFLPNETPEQCHARCRERGNGWSHAFYLLNERWCPVSYPDERPTDVRKIQPRALSETREGWVTSCFLTSDWEKMGAGIQSFPEIDVINLQRGRLSEESIAALFGGSRTRSFPSLKRLNLTSSAMGPQSIRALVPFLKSRPFLEELDLSDTDFNDEGARVLSEAFGHMRIGKLYLNRNPIGDAGLECLLSAANSRYLTVFSLVDCAGIRTPGFNTLSQFLQRSDTELRKFLVNPIPKESATLLAASVSNESNLRSIAFWDVGELEARGGRSTVVDLDQIFGMALVIQKLVCDTTSFQSLCESNHQVFRLGEKGHSIIRGSDDDEYGILAAALGINAEGVSAVKKMRRKLRAFYFSKAEFDLAPFTEVDVKLMPYVLELVTRAYGIVVFCESGETRDNCQEVASSRSLGSIYRLVRNCHMPDLFSYPSPESQMQDMKARIDALEKANNELAAENEALRKGSSDLPSKRTKTIV